MGSLVDEAAAFARMPRDRGEIMVCPELLAYVGKEFERGSIILKQV